MKSETDAVIITKATGEQEPFNREKLLRSLLRSGADPGKVEEIVQQISGMIVPGMTTRKIYRLAFHLLNKAIRPVAARYKLKQAIMELGPSGFPFEQFVAEVLRHQGYTAKTGTIVQGTCITHEIDVIAEKDNHHFMIECKYHNRPGFVCDVKIPLYIQSRFKDVESQWVQLAGHEGKFHQGWVVTNTRYSADAKAYGQCIGLNLIGWDYPAKGSLKNLIDEYGLYPVTCLTTLTGKEKEMLLNKSIVLCKALHQNYFILEGLGIGHPRLKRIMDECNSICESISTVSNSPEKDGK